MGKILAVLSALIDLLSRILAILQQRQRERTSREYQEKADAAKADIASAFNAHFGGVCDGTGDNANTSDKAGNRGKG